ncbi:(2Fe-2S)-binding protein [Kineosporia succinea]|uniref:Ferric siderophore reductase C-terminal domain-containing protein n=1 Tax=Kineosporia succinea TaxID=84632 RepID=A0ABT9P1X9_9ACTN|nr:(2Fe-2S)-binding protein [Kineosporia succinea]MDP9826439.1 hypothetical protein [Kineosporia succinea]
MRLLAQRLTELDPESPHAYAAWPFGEVPERGRWITPREVIEAMLTSEGPHLRHGPAVTGARLIGSLGYAAAGRLGVAIANTGQAYDTGPDSLVLRLDDEGLVAQIAVRSTRFAVLPTDELAGTPGVDVTEDLAGLVSWAARNAYATLAPLIEQIHARTRYGTVAMWNQVADSVLSPTTKSPALVGGSQEAGRAAGQLFLDALVAEGAPIRRRGTVRILENSTLDPVRGMCCLFYRQDEEKCGGCPLVKTAP